MYEKAWENRGEIGSFGADNVPLVSTAKGIYEAWSGYDPIAKRQLDVIDRVLSGVGAIPVVGGTVKRAGKAIRMGVTAAEVVKSSKSLEKVAKHVVKFQDMEVRAVRDLSHLDVEALQEMREFGKAAQNMNSKKITLHHLNQNPAGPLVEIPKDYSNIWNPRQHPFGNASGKGLTVQQRNEFNKWRKEYWKIRAEEELKKRGL